MDLQGFNSGISNTAFSITLDSIQELPGVKEAVKNEYKSGIANEQSHASIESVNLAKKSIETNTNGILQLMNQMDPMLSWQKLSRKILSKYSLFEDALERAHLKSIQNSQNNLEKLFEPPPLQIFQILLVQIDELIDSIKTMLEECCNVLPFENESSQQILHLNSSQSQYLFGTPNASLSLKSIEEIPAIYHEKLFRTSNVNDRNSIDEPSFYNEEYNETKDNVENDAIDPIEIDEPNSSNINEENTTDSKKKKRSRQKFSQCDKCQKTWNDIRSFKVHQTEPGKCPGKPWFKVLPGKRYLCIHPICFGTKQEFQNQSIYWNHVRELHWIEQDLVVECPHCHQKFPLIEMMKYHIKLLHPKTKMCGFCGSVFATKNDLAKHERTHTGEKPFACDKCTFRTSTAGTLKGHIKRRHEDPNLHRTFLCNQCEKGFFSAFDLKQHILTHSDVKRYTCPACGKQLKNDSCYRRHMVCVHGQKYSCELCSKDYSALMGLNIHKRDVHGIIT